jgi:hypothetical protein
MKMHAAAKVTGSVILSATLAAVTSAVAPSTARADEPPSAPPVQPVAPPSDAAPQEALLPASSSPTDTPPPPRYTRGQAVGLGLLSAVFGLGTLGVDQLPSPALGQLAPGTYYHYGTQLLASAPLAAVSPIDGLEVGGLDVGLIGASLELRRERAINNDYSPYWSAAEVLALHQGIYAAYATYRDARVGGSSDAWNDNWRPWTADELVVAPLQPKNYRPVGLISLGAEVGLLSISGVSHFASGGTLPRTAGRDIALGMPLAFDAGVTEEALFRGFLYEELKLSLGRGWARPIDMALFSAAHVPGELASGESAVTIGAGLVSRAVFALLAEIAYDEGGLPESVALHSMWDSFAFVLAAVTGLHPLGATISMGNARPSGSAAPTEVVVPILSGRF